MKPAQQPILPTIPSPSAIVSSNPEDQEIAGLIAASFAYGNVKIILRNLEFIFSRIGRPRGAFVEHLTRSRALQLFAGFKHRFNDAVTSAPCSMPCRLMLEDCRLDRGFFLQRL